MVDKVTMIVHVVVVVVGRRLHSLCGWHGRRAHVDFLLEREAVGAVIHFCRDTDRRQIKEGEDV